MKRNLLRGAKTLLLAFFSALLFVPAHAQESFSQCKTRLNEMAVNRGIDRETANSVFAQLTYQPRVIELDRSQPEFVQTFPGYFSKRVTQWRVDKGREMLAKHGALLAKLNEKYGVPPHYLLAFWGLETNFGSYKGKMPVLDSLATLACDPRRSDYFTQELMVALQLLQREGLTAQNMIGSWAGAMGHTQFMPSAYINYAKDGDGNGQINLWDSEEDALTSAANFLAQLGWQRGFRWGREVNLPDNFDYTLAGYSDRRTVAQWSALGITKTDGNPVGTGDLTAYLVVPAGHQGPAFIAYPNFRVILRWNNSEFYAIAVGHLADRIAGGPELSAALPELPAYSRTSILSLQKELNRRGYDVGKPDGIIGPATRAGIRQFQTANQMIPDGFPSLEVMQAMGIKLDT
ncbi:lytic murein transglycosylase [Alteromonas aestuariivivens]|uniref:Lytic murein transglycosylase n=1 Tax=Alteromonas aestuariivivens TaxID=1938339 RepID=A0A3D8MA49_9ALTE|nr:lytic murein transglycosylase [Alteromonas aestuariivivens]RDV26859.1 lytic murein transglycosylase [Alteromonas aestuariivivens]